MLYHSQINVLSDVDDVAADGSITQGFKPPLAIITQNVAGAATLPFVNYLSDAIKSKSYGGLDLTSGTTYTFQLPIMA